MKFLKLFILIFIITLSGCGKDVERKIEVTIKDKASNPTKKKNAAKKNKLLSFKFKNYPVSNIIETIKKLSKENIFYPDWFKDEKITLSINKMSVGDILEVIAEKTDTILDELDTGFILSENDDENDDENYDESNDENYDNHKKDKKMSNNISNLKNKQNSNIKNKLSSINKRKQDKLKEFALNNPENIIKIYDKLLKIKEEQQGTLKNKTEIATKFKHRFYKTIKKDPENIPEFLKNELSKLNIDKKIISNLLKKSFLEKFKNRSNIKNNFKRTRTFNRTRSNNSSNDGFFND